MTLLMLSFGTFTQQSVAINIRRVENSSALVNPSRTVSRALSYMSSDLGLINVPIVTPEGPFPTPVMTTQPNRFQGGLFNSMYLITGPI
jgi:hypothetical protein